LGGKKKGEWGYAKWESSLIKKRSQLGNGELHQGKGLFQGKETKGEWWVGKKTGATPHDHEGKKEHIKRGTLQETIRAIVKENRGRLRVTGGGAAQTIKDFDCSFRELWIGGRELRIRGRKHVRKEEGGNPLND